MKKVTVQYVPDYNYAQLLTEHHHAFIADEPDEAGGDDLGPGPYELLLWALGACTNMTVLMYARRKGWEVEDISITITHDRVHSQDAREESTGKVEVIERHISIRGNLTEEQRARLLEIAGRCPVHRTITGSPKVIDTLISGD